MLRFSFSERLILSNLSSESKSFDEIADDLREDFPEYSLRILLQNLFERKAIIRKGDCYRLRKPAKKFAV